MIERDSLTTMGTTATIKWGEMCGNFHSSVNLVYPIGKAENFVIYRKTFRPSSLGGKKTIIMRVVDSLSKVDRD